MIWSIASRLSSRPSWTRTWASSFRANSSQRSGPTWPSSRRTPSPRPCPTTPWRSFSPWSSPSKTRRDRSVKTFLAIYQREQNWRQAASVLDVETFEMYSVEEKLETSLKIARLYCKNNDIIEAAEKIQWASELSNQTQDKKLLADLLAPKSWISDLQKDFIDAAVSFIELSKSDVVKRQTNGRPCRTQWSAPSYLEHAKKERSCWTPFTRTTSANNFAATTSWRRWRWVSSSDRKNLKTSTPTSNLTTWPTTALIRRWWGTTSTLPHTSTTNRLQRQNSPD